MFEGTPMDKDGAKATELEFVSSRIAHHSQRILHSLILVIFGDTHIRIGFFYGFA